MSEPSQTARMQRMTRRALDADAQTQSAIRICETTAVTFQHNTALREFALGLAARLQEMRNSFADVVNIADQAHWPEERAAGGPTVAEGAPRYAAREG